MDRRGGEELHVGAEIIAAALAVVAPPTADARLQSNTVSGDERFHLAADLLHDPGALVPDHHRLLDDEASAPQCLL